MCSVHLVVSKKKIIFLFLQSFYISFNWQCSCECDPTLFSSAFNGNDALIFFSANIAEESLYFHFFKRSLTEPIISISHFCWVLSNITCNIVTQFNIT